MPQHEAFLNPKLSLDIQDRYIARSTVLHALPAQPHHFHSTFLSIGSGVQPCRSLITAESIREEHHVGMDLEDEHVDSTMATELLEACRIQRRCSARSAAYCGPVAYYSSPYLFRGPCLTFPTMNTDTPLSR